MVFDARSPLHRFRVDARVARRNEIERLEALGVGLAEISRSESSRLFSRFVREFVEPERTAQLVAELEHPNAKGRAFDFDRWLRPESIRHGEAAGCVRWLRAGAASTRCVRFERRVHLPALSIDLATLHDVWAASWPGLFVSFDVGRAVVVTLDYEELRCDVRAPRATPYR